MMRAMRTAAPTGRSCYREPRVTSMMSLSIIRTASLTAALVLMAVGASTAQERLPWERQGEQGWNAPQERSAPSDGRGWSRAPDAEPSTRGYDRPEVDRYREQQTYGSQAPAYGNPQGYASPPGYGADQRSTGPAGPRYGANDAYRPQRNGYETSGGQGYGSPYSAPSEPAEPYDRNYGGAPDPRYSAPRQGYDEPNRGYYTQNEIMNAGHGFFGSVSKGLASAVEWTFQKAGRPNGYILGEDAGGAFVAGLRYGEGTLHTKDAGRHKVYWQGPSLGYDVGAEGSKTMVLVYNLRDPSEVYHRFGGVQGAAYLVGGVSVQLQKHNDVVLALIRSGVGVRLGANVGYLKYTRQPTWNPF